MENDDNKKIYHQKLPLSYLQREILNTRIDKEERLTKQSTAYITWHTSRVYRHTELYGHMFIKFIIYTKHDGKVK